MTKIQAYVTGKTLKKSTEGPEKEIRNDIIIILTEIDEKPAIALTLVLGKYHYTGNIVFLLTVFFLAKKMEIKVKF